MPLPYVHYPSIYGYFVGFSEKINSPVYLCSCSRQAVYNFIVFNKGYDLDRPNNFRLGLLESRRLPNNLAVSLGIKGYRPSDDIDLFSEILFLDSICHCCNRTVPSCWYGRPMYFDVFTQVYGNYVNQEYLKSGIYPLSNYFINDCLESEVFEWLTPFLILDSCVNVDCDKAVFVYKTNVVSSEVDEIFKRTNKKLSVNLKKVIKFPLKSSGLKEYVLFRMVRSLLNGKISFNSRPSFLDGLQLDIYLPDLKVAIEYQGTQHYTVVQHWGGQEGLARRRKQDAKKARLCKKHRIQLIKYSYKEDLNYKILTDKLAEAGIQVDFRF